MYVSIYNIQPQWAHLEQTVEYFNVTIYKVLLKTQALEVMTVLAFCDIL